MPLLAAWIGNLIASVVSFFALYVGQKVALKLAAIAVVVAITGTFMAAMYALALQAYASIPTGISVAMSWVIPGNFGLCVGLIIAAHVARWAYDFQLRLVGQHVL